MFDFLKKKVKEDPVFPEEINDFKPISESKKEWIWVEGYKGTDKNMCCRNFQYELNKTFICEGIIDIGVNGFHFVKELSSVFEHYNLNRHNRFFKIKALTQDIGFIKNQYVAKEIIFEKELNYDDLKFYIEKYLPFIENKEEYLNCKDYDSLCKDKFIKEMQKLGFTELFSHIICNEISIDKLPLYLNKAKSYIAEDVSKDMLIYLLNEYQKDLIVSSFIYKQDYPKYFTLT